MAGESSVGKSSEEAALANFDLHRQICQQFFEMILQEWIVR